MITYYRLDKKKKYKINGHIIVIKIMRLNLI